MKSYQDGVAILHAMALLRVLGTSGGAGTAGTVLPPAAPTVRSRARSWLEAAVWDGNSKDAAAFEALRTEAIERLQS